MNKADGILLNYLKQPKSVNIRDELCGILDRFNDNKGHQTYMSNSLRMEREIDRLIDREYTSGY